MIVNFERKLRRVSETQLWFLVNQINMNFGGLILLILICDCEFQAKSEASIECNLDSDF